MIFYRYFQLIVPLTDYCFILSPLIIKIYKDIEQLLDLLKQFFSFNCDSFTSELNSSKIYSNSLIIKKLI